jgi:hypothetical protein
MDKQGKTGIGARIKNSYYRFRDRNGSLKRIICEASGHEYPIAVVPACCLYFCKRCGKEICGRTLDQIDTLAPMTEELRESIDQIEEFELAERQERDGLGFREWAVIAGCAMALGFMFGMDAAHANTEPAQAFPQITSESFSTWLSGRYPDTQIDLEKALSEPDHTTFNGQGE